VGESTAEGDWIARASAAFAFYGAMLGGTLGGQAAGIVLDALAGTRTLWIPVACSAVLEGVAGGLASSRFLTPREAARVSIRYSAALVAGTAILVAWIVASHAWAGAQLHGVSAGSILLGVLFVGLGAALRAALLTRLSRRRA
jgi:hypothetical protein